MSKQMKDSGVSWIGEIPEDWKITKIKYTTKLNGRIGWQGLTSDEYQETGPYLITGTDFEKGKINFKTAVHIEESRWKEATQIQVKNGDLLITKDGTVGKVAIISGLDDKASLNSGVLRIQPIPMIDTKFLYYILISEEFWLWFNFTNSGASTILHLYQNVFDNFSYVIPSALMEQKAIADYLDKQTAKFDQAARLLTDEISTLRAYKKSLIYETVTKGLDKTASLKDSGVDWIGEIPVGWEVKPIKYIFEIIGSGSTPKSDREDFYDGEFPWIQSGDLYQTDKVVKTSKTLTEIGQKSSSALTIYKAPFLAIAMYGASIGNLAISKIDASVNQAVAVLKDDEVKVRFGKYALTASKSEIINEGLGGTQPNISQVLLKGWHLPQPNLTEQKAIADYLDEKTNKINEIIKIKEQQLTNLSEQRKAFIYGVVTGKRGHFDK
ncbi:restriction endonuclease subunit S [Lactococcus sp. S47]|uniref:restriction endonuclease subunit S n=1 Tax=Lactococcus sp. S47 TaxID=2767460 RepID=UPI0019044E3D|nr:restriction endonuclease subunit S [Lactococcus sp. S47]MBK0028828.1 restriction endonuclease subunit S [Lactococcus sp. S47]